MILQDELGKGNYGEVRKVYHKTTKVTMAMKVSFPAHGPAGQQRWNEGRADGLFSWFLGNPIGTG
jgi:serine/threonine protein kinase